MKPYIVFDIETAPYKLADLTQFLKKDVEFDEDACKREFSTAREDSPKGREFLAKKRAAHEADLINAKVEFAARAALKPETGSVISIGYAMTDGHIQTATGDEKDILSQFWAIYNEADAKGYKLVGWNNADFDVPFLLRRSWKLGVFAPTTLFTNNRYLTSTFVDLMKVYTCGVYGERASLNHAAKHLLGVGKDEQEVTGETFHKYFFGTPDQRKLALEYLERDIKLTAEIAAKIL